VLRHLRDFRSYQVIIEIIRLAGRLAVINVQEIYELITALVEGFGCRPIAAMRLAPWPASESLQ
jgi:hypothetical protein